ncbi:MAG: N-formylglutamate amidohydrolase [Polyangiaceae bacterium]|nr:N-formylglutamate amidohydrolase [Polyangiaceae bacterium]
MTDPFVIERPDPSRELPVVVEVPHAGVSIDPPSLAYMVAPIRSLGRDADLYVDEVFRGAASWGATLLVARLSRFVVDLNRARDDYDGHSAEGGMAENRPRGLIWRTTTEGEPILLRRLPRTEVERRLELVYDPYHQTLARLLAEKKAKFGFAILLAGHSMPSTGRRGHVDVGRGRADVVPGTRGRTTAGPEVIACAEQAAEKAGFSLRHDDPYQGGYSTTAYGRPDDGVHALQIELARRVYMDEDALVLSPEGLGRTRGFAEDLVRRLGAVSP